MRCRRRSRFRCNANKTLYRFIHCYHYPTLIETRSESTISSDLTEFPNPQFKVVHPTASQLYVNGLQHCLSSDTTSDVR